jgi:membrane glycosyltransferase
VVENQAELAQAIGTPLVIRLTRFLALYVLGMLFIPKLLAAVQAGWSGRAAGFGGRLALAFSAIAETLVSMVVAPVLMVFHTRFVIAALMGTTVRWGSQVRSIGDHPTLKDFVRPNLIPTLVGVAFAVLIGWRNPGLIPWMTPILLGLIFSIPLSYWLASDRLGAASRRTKLFLNPPETMPDPILVEYQASQRPEKAQKTPGGVLPAANGVFAVVIDPLINRLHTSVSPGSVNQSLRTQAFRQAAAERLLAHGLEAVTPFELRTILWDAQLMQKLHLRVWSDSSTSLHPSWISALAAYRASHTTVVDGNLPFQTDPVAVPK